MCQSTQLGTLTDFLHTLLMLVTFLMTFHLRNSGVFHREFRESLRTVTMVVVRPFFEPLTKQFYIIALLGQPLGIELGFSLGRHLSTKYDSENLRTSHYTCNDSAWELPNEVATLNIGWPPICKTNDYPIFRKMWHGFQSELHYHMLPGSQWQGAPTLSSDWLTGAGNLMRCNRNLTFQSGLYLFDVTRNLQQAGLRLVPTPPVTSLKKKYKDPSRTHCLVRQNGDALSRQKNDDADVLKNQGQTSMISGLLGQIFNFRTF